MSDEITDSMTAVIPRLKKLERELAKRLTRTESRIVRGFAELGVDVGGEPGWVDLNDDDRVVRVNTLGRSWVVLMSEMERLGAQHYDKFYEVVFDGEVIGSVKLLR